MIDLVESLYADLAASSTTPLDTMRILGVRDSAAVACYFKRSLFLDLASFLSLASLLARAPLADYDRVVLESRWPGAESFAATLGRWRRDRFQTVEGVRLRPELASALDRLELERPHPLQPLLAAARAIAYSWLQALRGVRPFARPPGRARLLVQTYASDLGIDLGGITRLRNVDYVVDGERIRGEDTRFWAESGIPQERLDAVAARGYRVASRGTTPSGVVAFLFGGLPLLVRLTGLLLRLTRRDRWWLRTVPAAAATYLLWSRVARQLRPRAFLLVNDLMPSGTVRNLALRERGCTTVQYQHSCHWRPGRDGWIRDYVFAFGVVDAVVTWGPAHSRHVLAHHGSFGEAWEVGCLWSEHARRIAEEPELRERFRDLLDQRRVTVDAFDCRVGVFDTSLGLLDADELEAFRDGVRRLARRLPDVLFLVKPKNVYEPAAEELAEPNVAWLPNRFDTAAVLAFSELSISACFTSTAVEGMGLARPVLFYDPTRRFPHAFWRRIPGLVCETDDELHARTRELLWGTTHEDNLAWLREHCAELEGRFDGRALTRFRERLADSIGA